jgi:hypothetical protein
VNQTRSIDRNGAIAFAANAEVTLREVEAAARSMGLQIHVLNASISREIDAAFWLLGG